MFVDIHNIDCFEFLKTLDKESVNLILVDLPYCISRPSGFTNKCNNVECASKFGKLSIDFGEWDKQELDLTTLLKEFYRVLKKGGTLICFYDIWKMGILKESAEKVKFKQPRLCCWQKTNPVPINSKLNYLSNAKEYFVTFVKQGKPTFHSEYDKGDYFVDVATDTYLYPIVHGKERTKHPTQKPVKLIEQLILKHSNTEDIVLDSFMGSGTTGVACINNNRSFIGVELDSAYFDIASTRINKAFQESKKDGLL